MGNKCHGCLFVDNDGRRGFSNCCKGSKKPRKQSENVLPEDLHASGMHKNTAEPAEPSSSSRPGTLQVNPVLHGDTSSGATTKFPAFSLHGVQKSSPTTASGHGTPVDGTTPDALDINRVERLYNSYCDEASDEDIISADGVERFCLDLEVDPTEFIVLALAWKFKAATMCKFTKKEFVEGFVNLRCDSIKSLQSSFKRIELDAISNFKDLYRFTFQFALDVDEGQRSLPCDIAIAMWNVVFSRDIPSLLDSWITFLQDNKVRGISRDTWNMFLYLIEALNDDLSNYNDNEAWPSLFDDFVEYKREKIEIAKNSTEIEPSLDNNEEETTSDENPVDSKINSTSQLSPTEEDNEIIETKPDLPGTIASSTESNCDRQFSDVEEVDQPPSEPGQILCHLHSEL